MTTAGLVGPAAGMGALTAGLPKAAAIAMASTTAVVPAPPAGAPAVQEPPQQAWRQRDLGEVAGTGDEQDDADTPVGGDDMKKKKNN